MPGTRCTVSVCNNSLEKTKRAGLAIAYHNFPKSVSVRNIWIQRCRRAGNWNPSSCHVCSVHFTENDYVKDDQTTNYPGKKMLKATAIPSLFLTKPPPIFDLSSLSRKRRATTKFSTDEDNENTIYFSLKNSDEPTSFLDNPSIFEICDIANSNEEASLYTTEQTIDTTIKYVEGDSEYIDVLIESAQENSSKGIQDLKYEYLNVKDACTQTDISNLTIEKNEILEKEISTWKNRCKKLMSNVQFLQKQIINPNVPAAHDRLPSSS